MDETDHVSDAKLLAFILVGAIGTTVILIADFANRGLHKGFEWINVIDWF